MQHKVKALRRKSRKRCWNLYRRHQVQTISQEKDRASQSAVIVPAEVNWRVNEEGEEYAVIRTPDGAYYTVRNNIVFDEDGFDQGKAPADWLEALLLKK